MGVVSLHCQICDYTCTNAHSFKKHLGSPVHILKVKQVFPKDGVKGFGFLPYIGFLDMHKQGGNYPIVGVSLLTLCLCSSELPGFYLCHACEECCPIHKILDHLRSGNHYSNYFNYTDPSALSFSWMSGMDVRTSLWSQLTNETKKSENLQILHLPSCLTQKLKSSTYSEVMKTLRENDKLLQNAAELKRTTIQSYQRDSNRKHPLLGMQHLVQCVCVGSAEKSHYLCTLCSLTVSSHMIIKHVLSFDHIFCYFKAWHPSTLPSKDSQKKYSKFFASKMLNLAKQSEKIHEAANTDMKQVSLEPAEFESVNFTCYAEALKKLESITNSSLTTTVTPGKKLEYSTATPPCTSPNKLRCQVCSLTVTSIFQFVRHMSDWRHKQNVKKYFGEAEGFDYYTAKFYLGLYSYVQDCFSRSEPAVGAHLVVACITTQVEESPVYVCFACQECFPQWLIDQHFTSRKHLVHSLMYQNPWQLPFGWEDHVDDTELIALAWEEEKERGKDEMALKVFDISPRILRSFTPLCFSKVLDELKLYRTLLKREVPPCGTYSKLQQNERFPLLGNQFLVRWYCDDGGRQHSGCLCLLCKRLLADIESYTHIFSREHASTFLDCFHPGSLNPSTDNVDTLLDLAKQAGRNHPILHVQVVQLERPIREPCPYITAKQILYAAVKNTGGVILEPPIITKRKLVPRKTLKKVDKDCVSDNSQKSSSNTNQLCVESGQQKENEGGKVTPKPSENEANLKREGLSGSEATKSADKTYPAIKEEAEEPTMTTPSGEISGSVQSTDRDDGAEKREEKIKEIKDEREESSTLLPNYLCECRSLKIPKKDDHLVVDMEIDDSEDSEAAAEMPSKTETTFKTTEVPPKSNKSDTVTHIKVPEPADNSHTCSTVSRSSEDALSINVPTGGTNRACLPSASTCNESKACIPPKTTVASLKVTFKREDLAAACSKLTGSTSSATMSNTTSKSAAASRPLESRTVTPCNNALTSRKRSAAVRDATCRTATSSKTEIPPKCPRAALSSETPKTSVKCENSGTSAKTEHVKHSEGGNADGAPRIHKSEQLAAPHSTTATTYKTPPVESTHTSTSNTRPKKSTPRFGLNQFILVSCEGKQQIYCQLCSVRLTHGRDIHLFNPKHQLNYVKLHYPGQNLHLSKNQLRNVIENLAKVERNLESQSIQMIEVNKDVYHELNALPRQKAFKELKKIMGKRYKQPSPSSTTAPAEILRRDAAGASPCEVSSTADGICMPQNEVSGHSTNNQPEQEDKNEQDENEQDENEQEDKNELQTPNSRVGQEAGVAATRSVRGQSVDCEVTQAGEDQLRPSSRSNEKDPEPNTRPSVQTEEKRDVNKEDLVTDRCQETPDRRQQQRRSDVELRPTQKTPEGEKSRSCSRLSTYLRVKRLDTEPIIGLGSVWECQGISQKTFFLCESCRKMLSLSDICQHMVSFDHLLQCMWREHGRIMAEFWSKEDVAQEKKQELLSDVAKMIADRERFSNMDAQVVILGQEMYDSVRTAPFSEAVKMVQKLKNDKLSAFCLPASTSPHNNQQPEDRQNLTESLPTEMQSSEALETNQRRDNAEVFPTG